ncbi:MAG: LuxR C-terminal-related transcriptional regulator [Bacteroidota bacterium]
MPIKNYHTILADTQYLVTESLSMLISQMPGYKIKGISQNIDELKSLLKEKPQTHLLIIDYFLFDFKEMDEFFQMLSPYPGIKVLILTNAVRPVDVNEFKKAGIHNILYKTAERDEILQAIQYTLQGKKYYADEIMDMLIAGNSSRNEVIAPAVLTPAETEITKLIASGLTTKKIADQKHKSFHTIMSHRKNIFRKLNINNTSELVRYAIKSGLIDNIEYYI